jgi:LysM repeat protein
VRILAVLFTLALSITATFRSSAQESMTQTDPGAVQDAEATREKLLKAADQLDNIQANSEATKVSVDGIKADDAALQASVTKLQTDNASLRQQLSDMQAAFDQYKADQAKVRQTLIDNVADMIAAGKSSTKIAKKKKEEPPPTDAPEAAVKPPEPTTASNLAPPPEVHTAMNTPSASAAVDSTTPPPDDAPPPKPQKGYYHIVASGETLTLICEAYRENGVNVTVSQIRKANGLTEKSSLKAGQKLFIPKPGT